MAVGSVAAAGSSIYSSVSQARAADKARDRSGAIEAENKSKLKAFRDRLSSGGRGLLGSIGDDELGTTLGS